MLEGSNLFDPFFWLKKNCYLYGMVVDKEAVIDLFQIRSSGSKGWFIGTCPYCKSKDKFGIIFGDEVSSFNCFSGGCQEKGSLYDLLKYVDRLDLISFSKSIDIEKPLEIPLDEDILEVEEEYEEAPIQKLPMGFIRKYENDYLRNERGWKLIDFQEYEVGTTALQPKLSIGYVIFPVRLNGEIRGYVSRAPFSKKECDEKDILRWRNSTSDFGKLLYGYDEINKDTTTVILVEGIFAKRAIDKALYLSLDDSIKCNATFGKKISDDQIRLLKEKGVNHIIICYDFDAVEVIKELSLQLSHSFEVQIADINKKDSDPDDLSESEILDMFEDLKDPLYFQTNKVQQGVLKV